MCTLGNLVNYIQVYTSWVVYATSVILILGVLSWPIANIR